MVESLQEEKTLVRTGAEYLESLRDGRAVFYKGELIEDVTEHPATAGGTRTIAKLYDAQHAPESRDILTYLRDDGARVTAAYMLPRTKADLSFRREGIECVARQTFAAIIAAWRDGYTDALARHTALGVAEVRELFDCVVDAIGDPHQYVVWHIPIVSGRKA